MAKNLPATPMKETFAERLERSFCAPLKVLLVEDNEYFSYVLNEVAKREFAVEISFAATLAAARSMLKTERFDVVILDQVLSNGQGIELYAEIVAQKLPVIAVFLTAYASQEFRAKVEKIGPARVHSKDAMARPEFMHLLFDELGARRISLCGPKLGVG
jgi:DNA-binding NarL/FixJ family response regulator